jgi:Carboxypeptidase regulatory-like domain/TonB dependent receptor-like, beta-barrel/TonB-dependent Receptor Plug Domain
MANRFTGLLSAHLLLIAFAAAAQTRATTADLSGRAVDQTKAVLPGVTVMVTNIDTGLVRTAVTDTEGRFATPALPPGTYDVRGELQGFAPQSARGIILTLGAAVEITLTMAVAGAQEQITVSATSPLVDIQKTAVSTVVSQQQIESLPINGRNFISFAVITPGVTTDRTPQQGASATSGLTFAGQRARSNNITVDGLDNNDPAVNAVRATFSQEAVREFQVLTNSYSAEFGKASGGVVNIVTKSGTNRTTGNLFGYFRDETLNAKEHFEKFDPAGNPIDREKAPYAQQQWGGTVGGPLRRDRSFYFLSFERLDIDTNNFVNIDDRTIIRVGTTTFGTPKQILERAGFPVETGNVPYIVEGTQFLAKVDQELGQAGQLSVRFNYADAFNENIEPWGGQVARSRGASADSQDTMVAGSLTSLRGTRLVNELRFQFARRDQDVLSLDPRCGGTCTDFDQGGPTLEVTGYASVGRQRFTPQPRRNRRFQVLDTLSYFVGNHQLKTGVDFSALTNKDEALPLHFGGRYIFAAALPGALLGLPVPTIDAIQAVALGVPAAYVQGYGDPVNSYDVSDLSLFAQDDWRLTPNFTLKLGMRYQTQFWPEVLYDPAGIAPYTFRSDHNNIAPRLAFAWDPVGDKKTSIHGAYGIFFDNHIIALSGITALINGRDQVRTFVAQLPNMAPLAAWNAPGRRLPEPTPGSYPSLKITADPGLTTPYAHHAAVGLDRELGAELAVSVNAVYARGFDQLGTIDYNPIVPALGTGRRPEDVGGRAGTSASILQYTSFGETWYRGLTLAANKRFADRYQLMASYTLSKAEDTSTDFQSAFVPQDNGRGRNPQDLTGLPLGFDPDSERGPSTQDQRHRFVLSGLYVAPGDVQLSSIVTIASGRPYNILAGADLNGDGNGGAFPPDRARANPADPATSVGRNTGTLPNYATVDLRVSRRFPLGSRASVDGLFEVFNLFNRTNYTEINNIFGTGAYPANPLPTFGQFTQAAPPRQVQLAVKINF